MVRPTRELGPRSILSSGLGGAVGSVTLPVDASDVSIVDAGDYYAGTDVEAALQELGPLLALGGDPHIAFVASSGPTETINCDVARYWDITLTDDCTFTFTNPPDDQKWGQLVLVLRQGTGAPWTVTWPASVQWQDPDTGLAGGPAPTLWTTEDAIDVVTLVTEDGGITWGGNHGAASGGTTLTAAALEEAGVVGPILIADDHSTPIVFGDLLLTEDGDDFLYADVGV